MTSRDDAPGSEFARIARLSARFTKRDASTDSRDGLGIGDDAAVLAPTSLRQVISVDAAIEEVHFRRAWMSLETLGRRATIAALSDVIAMGARPRHVLSSLALPVLTEDSFDELIEGIASAAEEAGATVIGGNLASAEVLSIHTTVIGECPRPVQRNGARPGDGIFVVGRPGSAGLGLAAITHQSPVPLLAPFVDAFQRPLIPFAMSSTVHELASAAIDLSDGLVADLAHLTRASSCGASLDFDKIPALSGRERAASLLKLDERHAVLFGGEDYALLFTSDRDRVDGATRIGTITEGDVIRVDGDVIDPRGFDHFATSS